MKRFPHIHKSIALVVVPLFAAASLLQPAVERPRESTPAFAVPPQRAPRAVEPSLIAVTVTPTPTPVPEPSVVLAATGNTHDWYLASAIPAPWEQVNWLVSKESSWNPNAVNPSSGACGLGQQLPCGKWAHAWNDPVGGLIDMHEYVLSRYGSWEAAVAHSKATGWY